MGESRRRAVTSDVILTAGKSPCTLASHSSCVLGDASVQRRGLSHAASAFPPGPRGSTRKYRCALRGLMPDPLKWLKWSFRHSGILMTFAIALIAVAVLFPIPCRAQNFGFPLVSPEDLKMTSDPKAPGAPAIILFRGVDRDDNGSDVARRQLPANQDPDRRGPAVRQCRDSLQ